jgi:CTP:molybdopterin cytidylyltransferase MocA
VTAPAPPAVAGLLLAAGAGRRMGRPKALVELDGEPLVRRGVRLLAQAGCGPVVVVVGARADEVRPLCEGAQVVEAADWSTGMAASLHAGLAALDADACVVALVDQPLVTPAAVERLRAAHRDGAVAAVATYDGRPRNPVLLDRSVWDEVAQAADGDEGARSWLRAHPDRVVHVDCSDAGVPTDVDTPQDLAVLAAATDPHADDPHAREAVR